jgi:NAD(P)-dependent dehydrogenase (short-subunit alcohol dehydrogenase family)
MAAENAPKYTHPALSGLSDDAVIGSMNALGRLAEPAEIAAVVAFLLSPEASYITGATIDAAGGWI